MRRFFADSQNVLENSIIIRDEEANHIKNVVRMQIGDTFIAVDGTGTDYMCCIMDIDKQIEADIISRTKNMAEPNINVTLYQAYPKSAKMQEIVQKAVELGVRGVVPFISKRCVKRPNGQSVSRLERVALSAVKQCGRSKFPNISEIQSFDNVLSQMKTHELLVVCWEEEQRVSLKQALQQSNAKDIGIVIGSEGGLEASEVERMREIGGVSVTVGRRIMRTETAGIAVLSAIFYDKEQMQY